MKNKKREKKMKKKHKNKKKGKKCTTQYQKNSVFTLNCNMSFLRDPQPKPWGVRVRVCAEATFFDIKSD